MKRVRQGGCPIGELMEMHAAPLIRPLRPNHVSLGSGSLALAGEAAGLVSASSAEGISYALRSGQALAEALESGIEGFLGRYRILGSPIIADVIGKMLKAHVLYDKGTRRLIMRSGLGAIRQAGHRTGIGPLHPFLGGFGDSGVDLAPK